MKSFSIKSSFLLNRSDVRRKELLSLQQQRRRNQLTLTRQMLDLDDGVLNADIPKEEQDKDEQIMNCDNIQSTVSLTKEQKLEIRKKELLNHYYKRRKWCSTLQWPEWMNEVPSDLFNISTSSQEDGWLVSNRLEGTRCILYTKSRKTYVRDVNGQFMSHCKSTLPGDILKGSGVMLDCIYSPSTHLCLIYDLYHWNNLYFSDYSFNYRFFFILSKIQESQFSVTIQNIQYSLQVAPFYDCSFNNLSLLYKNPCSYEKNGFLFVHKASRIETGLSPLVLQWKDKNICKYLINTDKNGNIPLQQSLTLQYSNSCFYTQDGICLLAITPEEVSVYNFDNDSLVNITIDSIEQRQDGIYQLINPIIINKCGYKKVLPDSLSKIIFQNNLRTNPLTFEQIMNNQSYSQTEDCTMMNTE